MLTTPPHPTVPLVLPRVKIQHPLLHQRRPTHLWQTLVQWSTFMTKSHLAIRSGTAISGVQELLDGCFGGDILLDFAGREVELIAPVWHAGLHDGGERCVGFGGGPVGGAD